MATIVKGGVPMERKRVRISSKRQITIPQKFFTELGFDTEAECVLRGNELVIRPVKEQPSGEFDEFILADLIKEGYSGQALLEEFRKRRSRIRPAVEKMIEEAERAAYGEGEFYTYEDIFGTEDVE